MTGSTQQSGDESAKTCCTRKTEPMADRQMMPQLKHCRKEGKYQSGDQKQTIIQPEPIDKLEAIQRNLKDTHMQAYEAYTTSWGTLMRTVLAVQKPQPKELAKIMLKAVRPMGLQNRIRKKTLDGLGPHKLDAETKQWRKDAKRDPVKMRRLIREHADHWDLMGWKRDSIPNQLEWDGYTNPPEMQSGRL